MSRNPTRWAVWKSKVLFTILLHENKEILRKIADSKPALVAIDAPLSQPKKGATRKADREMHKRGYKVLPLRFPAMEKLTLRATKLKKEIIQYDLATIEVHPTSTRKALKIPSKNGEQIQKIFIRMGLEGDLKARALTPHELDAATAALTGHLYLQGKTELVRKRTRRLYCCSKAK